MQWVYLANTYLTQANASSTYAIQASLSNYLRTANLDSTLGFAAENLTNHDLKTYLSNTYLTQTDANANGTGYISKLDLCATNSDGSGSLIHSNMACSGMYYPIPW